MAKHHGSDGDLKVVRWASDVGVGEPGEQVLRVALGARPVPLAHSNATGEKLVSNGFLGGDIIRLGAGDGFVPHTHPGDHLLVVVGGRGTITYGGKVFPTRAGEIYLIEGLVPHAVGAITDHVILAVGAPHRPLDALDRMTPVAYEAVTAAVDELHCLLCDIHAGYPQRLHDAGCPHCPCFDCRPLAGEGNDAR
jgi:mannose-6-phosphate isomerase-like protein (cupin superfamily)